MYFQLGDQFLVFFMSLILVFNIREEIMSSQNVEKADLISKFKEFSLDERFFFRTDDFNWMIYINFFVAELIQSSPASLDAGDLFDFNGLCQHFAAKTPQSFRKVSNKVFCLFLVWWIVSKAPVLFGIHHTNKSS